MKEEIKKPKKDMIAKKDFVLHRNDYLRVIKVGDDLTTVPEMYWPNLKTEGII